MLAQMEAAARAKEMTGPTKENSRGDGWTHSAGRMANLQALWAERDQHDETLKLDSVLYEEALRRLDTATEGDEPAGVLSELGVQELASIDPEVPIVVDDGTIAGGVDPWHEDDADSCASGLTGSSSHSEWALEHDDFGKSDWEEDQE